MKAGYAKICITPPAGSRLTGFSARHEVSTGVHDDLFVRSLVLAQGDRAVALVSVEVLALSTETVHAIRQRIAADTGIPPGDILVAATHTHSGPVTVRSFFNDHEEPDSQYLERLVQAAAASVARAWRTRFDAQVGVGGCLVEGLGVNRRNPDSTEVNRQAGILRLDAAVGETRAVAVIYGCHPTVLGFTNLEVSGDYPSAALNSIESALGPQSFAMFFNGAEGNVSIGHSAELSLVGVMTGDRTFEHAKILGELLASTVLQTLPSIRTSAEPALGTASITVSLDGRQYPAVEILQAKMCEARARCAALALDDPALPQARAKELYASIDYANARRLRALGGRILLEIQAIRLDGALLVGVPGEVFAETSLALDRKLPEPVFLIGLANGYVGYLPTADAFRQGGYEPRVASCDPGSEQRILDAASELDRQLSAITLLTPAEPLETVRNFHRKCRLDCGLGIFFAASAVVTVISPLADAWGTFAAALAVAAFTGTCFIRRWMLSGVFRGLTP